ncbi:tyrosine-type recombinase/integrase [Sandarakinorhabdus sp. DWP1-3-1]|uniref:tyrosine-type recombinase/integrase n=1 Tax=Sandarakinorhabdus sp. DWP1-3-1 TaxID=2804627 RepID=UPI003CE9BB88
MLYKQARSPYWRYDFVINGVRYSASTRTADKRAAAKIEADARLQAVTPNRSRPVITLDEAAALYAERAETLPSWLNAKRIIKVLLAGLGASTFMGDVTQRDLQLLVAKRRVGRANSSVNREIVIWRAIWRHADETRFDIGEMPAWGKLLLKVSDQPARTLSAAEETKLFAALRSDLHDFVAFALASGWRLSEVIRLTWRDVDMAQRTATTRIKGGDTIERPLGAAMLALIASQPRVCPQVFTFEAQATRSKHTTKDGRTRAARRKGERYPFSSNGWRKPWTAALAEAGIDAMRFHDLRHTRGTRILRATNNLPLTGKALGHRSLATTMRYAHVLNEDLRAGIDAADSVSPTIPTLPISEKQKA